MAGFLVTFIKNIYKILENVFFSRTAKYSDGGNAVICSRLTYHCHYTQYKQTMKKSHSFYWKWIKFIWSIFSNIIFLIIVAVMILLFINIVKVCLSTFPIALKSPIFNPLSKIWSWIWINVRLSTTLS